MVKRMPAKTIVLGLQGSSDNQQKLQQVSKCIATILNHVN